MSDVAVEVNHVWKKFHRGEFYDSLRDLVPAMAKRLLGRGPRRDELAEGDFWALKDVSFQVKRGEVLGVIGPNGAGKSTLLKILSKIIKPTRGSIRVAGRLRALIEIAAGFHGDLTGRENIYLNGTILGMKKREIDAKFDEIVEFAGIGPFLDTPVKRYSSGMYARLGFAVAAHLDPEILLVDEVLAVGDFAFQQKCLGKMRTVAGEGRTVLFVSHNMAAVESLCARAILLDKGQLIAAGDVRSTIQSYLEHEKNQRELRGTGFRGRQQSSTGGPPIIVGAELLDASGQPTWYVPLGGTFTLRIDFDVPEPIDLPTIGVGIDDVFGQRFLSVHTPVSRCAIPRLAGPCSVLCRIASLPLRPGQYTTKIALSARSGEIDSCEQALLFHVVDGDGFGEGRGFHRGLCVAQSEWTILTANPATVLGTTLPLESS